MERLQQAIVASDTAARITEEPVVIDEAATRTRKYFGVSRWEAFRDGDEDPEVDRYHVIQWQLSAMFLALQVCSEFKEELERLLSNPPA